MNMLEVAKGIGYFIALGSHTNGAIAFTLSTGLALGERTPQCIGAWTGSGYIFPVEKHRQRRGFELTVFATVIIVLHPYLGVLIELIQREVLLVVDHGH